MFLAEARILLPRVIKQNRAAVEQQKIPINFIVYGVQCRENGFFVAAEKASISVKIVMPGS